MMNLVALNIEKDGTINVGSGTNCEHEEKLIIRFKAKDNKELVIAGNNYLHITLLEKFINEKFCYKENTLYEDFSEDKVTTVNGLLDLFLAFNKYKSEFNEDSLGEFIITFNNKVLIFDKFIIFPIIDFYVIGKGRDYARAILFDGGTVEHAIDIAFKLGSEIPPRVSLYSSNDVKNIIKKSNKEENKIKDEPVMIEDEVENIETEDDVTSLFENNNRIEYDEEINTNKNPIKKDSFKKRIFSRKRNKLDTLSRNKKLIFAEDIIKIIDSFKKEYCNNKKNKEVKDLLAELKWIANNLNCVYDVDRRTHIIKTLGEIYNKYFNFTDDFPFIYVNDLFTENGNRKLKNSKLVYKEDMIKVIKDFKNENKYNKDLFRVLAKLQIEINKIKEFDLKKTINLIKERSDYTRKNNLDSESYINNTYSIILEVLLNKSEYTEKEKHYLYENYEKELSYNNENKE